MASKATAKTELFAQWLGGNLVVADQGDSTGARFWVCSTTGSDSAGYGRAPDKPLATLDYAIGLCTASANDVIYVMPGHAETYTTTGVKATFDVAGVKIIGLGRGSNRPTFTFTHADATWTWSAANVSIENLLFVTGIDSVVTFGTISGTDWTIRNCEARDTTDIEVINDWTVTGDRGMVDGYFKNGYTGGNANVAVFTFAGVDRCEIKNCRFITKVTTAVVNFTAACTAIEVHDCNFLVTSTTDVSKNVVDTGGGSTWAVWDCFDLGGSAAFSGGSAVAVAKDDVQTVQSCAVSVGTQASGLISSYGNFSTSYGNLTTSFGTQYTSVANLTTSFGNFNTSFGTFNTSFGTQYTSVANLTTSFGNFNTSYGNFNTSFGNFVTSFGNFLTSYAIDISYIRSEIAST